MGSPIIGGHPVAARSGRVCAEGEVGVMGVVNVTPDSFSDGGRYLDPERAAERGEELVAEGATLLDLGGESTRPGSVGVPVDEEMRRVLPALRRLRNRVAVPISIDTSKAAVARAALDEGADLINDVTAARGDQRMLDVLVAHGVPVVLMHMLGAPADMQRTPSYGGDDVVGEVSRFLRERAGALEDAGVPADRIIVDPGIGFGKTTAHNLALLARLDEIVALGYPVLIGASRKRFIGEVIGGDPDHRLEGTAAAVALAVDRGARLVRVHDVAVMARVVRMALALRDARRESRGESE